MTWHTITSKVRSNRRMRSLKTTANLILIRYKERSLWWFNHIARTYEILVGKYIIAVMYLWGTSVFVKNLYILIKGIRSTYESKINTWKSIYNNYKVCRWKLLKLIYSPFDICSCCKYFRCITFVSLCQALCCYYFTLSFSFHISLREPKERT